MKEIETWEAKIYCGLRRECSDFSWPICVVYQTCQDFIKVNPWCVTVTPTRFLYKGGWENGAIIGIIQYPRFPKSIESLKTKTIKLAEELKEVLQQFRVSVVFPDVTVLVE